MRVLPKILLALLLLAAALVAVAGCGSSSDGTVSIGTAELEVPSSDSGDKWAVLKAMVAHSAYYPWYQRCVVEEVEGEYPPKKVEALEAMSEAERKKALLRPMVAAATQCIKPGKQYINPHASESEFDVLRASQSEGIADLLESQGAGVAEARCAAEKVGELEPRELIVEMGEPSPQKTALFGRIAQACG